MTWQDQYITSTREALDFIKDHVCAVTGAHPDACFFSSPDNSSPNKKPIINKRKVDFDITCGDATLFSFKVKRNSSSSLDLSYVGVGRKGNGLGHAACKVAVAMAYEANAEAIRVTDIKIDGPAFWPTLGNVPPETPKDLGRHIIGGLIKYRNSISEDERIKLRVIADIANHAPYRGWIKASQVASHRGFRNDVFGRFCRNGELVLLPGVPVVKSILEKKLGRLPSFSPPGPTSKYRHIAAALA